MIEDCYSSLKNLFFNLILQKKCSKLESIDNNEQCSCRICLRIISILYEENETAEEVLKIGQTINEEVEVNIPKVNIGGTHHVVPKENNKQAANKIF